MSPLVQTFSLLAVASLAFITTVQSSPASMPEADAAGVPLRIMPLGASITYGQGSSTGNGYRNDLHKLLTDSGYTVNMVGSRKHGSMKDNDVEGWPGFLIDEVQSKAEAAVPSRLPNVFTINAGTNDCGRNFQLDGAGRRTDDLLEYLWRASPDSTIILSTLLINLYPVVEARVEKVNAQIKEVARQKAAQKKRIVLVDMHAADGPQKADLADATHPNDAGYNKMAKIWFRGIQEAAGKGFLKNPKPVPGA